MLLRDINMSLRVNCDSRRCKDWIAVTNASMSAPLLDIDWVHMNDQHLRPAETYWRKRACYLQEENIKLKSKLDNKPTVVISAELPRAGKILSPKPQLIKPADILTELSVDPRNHVTGICDALVTSGLAIYKCTDVCRHGKLTCPMHLNHGQLVETETAPVTTPLVTPVTTPLVTPVTTPLVTPVATPLVTPVATPVNSPVISRSSSPAPSYGTVVGNTPVSKDIKLENKHINDDIEMPVVGVIKPLTKKQRKNAANEVKKSA